jgi:hypothetical protein
MTEICNPLHRSKIILQNILKYYPRIGKKTLTYKHAI